MPRRKTAATASVAMTPEPPKPPTCAQCGKELDWRDLAYGGKPREAQKDEDGEDSSPAIGPTCKRCHQRNARSRFVVAFHPATRLIDQGKNKKPVETLVTHNRAARRGRLPLSMRPSLFDPQIAPRTRKPTRAERHATARKQAAEQAQAVA